jgi:hypothetical protein
MIAIFLTLSLSSPALATADVDSILARGRTIAQIKSAVRHRAIFAPGAR